MTDLVVVAGTRVSLALAGGLGLVMIAERRHLKEMTRRTLFLRWRTWAFSAPLFGAAAMGPVAIAAVFVALLSLQGVREYARLAAVPKPYRNVLYATCVASAAVAAIAPSIWFALPALSLLVIGAIPVFSGDADGGAEHVVRSSFAFLYVPHLLGYLILLKDLPGGGRILLALGMAVAVSDVSAFTFGRLFGKRLLAPAISPSKTVEGAVGNLVGAYVGYLLMSFAVPPMAAYATVLLPALVALAAILGDLFESAVKRSFKVKDAGSWLPGFGGLLDRIDSLLFVLPVSYGFFRVLG